VLQAEHVAELVRQCPLERLGRDDRVLLAVVAMPGHAVDPARLVDVVELIDDEHVDARSAEPAGRDRVALRAGLDVRERRRHLVDRVDVPADVDQREAPVRAGELVVEKFAARVRHDVQADREALRLIATAAAARASTSKTNIARTVARHALATSVARPRVASRSPTPARRPR
jgi:hypothetical protein